MLKNYIKIALRNLWKHKSYSAINILGLSVGVALSLLILIYVRHELSYDSFNENGDRIVRVNMQYERGNLAITPSMVAPSLSQVAPEIDKWVRLYEPTRYNPVIVSVGQNNYQEEHFLYADSSFFDIFTFKFLAGNASTALARPKSLVLTKSKALKLFGDIDRALGQTVQARIFSSVIDFEVTGIIDDVPSNSHFTFDYLGSLNTRQNWSQLSDSEVRSSNFYTYLLLNSAQSRASLQSKISDFIQRSIPEERGIKGLPLVPISEIYLHTGSQTEYEIRPMGNIRNIYGFIFLAFTVLLIATINYINLATARSSRRASEVGVRKTMGALRGQLIAQFYGESIILTLIAVAIALVFIQFTKDWFFGLMGQDIQFNLFADPTAWILLSVVVIITSALAGSYPALLLSSYQPIHVLKGLFGTSGSDSRLRKGLVITQFAISTFLILTTAIIVQQTNYVLNAYLGFDKEEILVISTYGNELAAKHDLLKSEILRQPGVISGTYMSNIPGKTFGGYRAESVPGQEPISTNAGVADKDLVKTLGIELLAGQSFPDIPGYTTAQGYKYLINESLASSFGWSPDEAIGRAFNVLGNREGEIVGVMKDFNYASLHEQVDNLALFMEPEISDYLLLKVNPQNIQRTLSSIEYVWEQLAPHRPFEFNFMDQQLNALYDNEVRIRNLLFLFSSLAILIACLGLIGLSSYLVEQKAKEIGIRKVLGASSASIVALLSSNFLKLVAIGFLFGAPLAWITMKNWLTGFAYHIDISIVVFVVTAALGLIVALLTVSWQALRAALANPVESLKNE